MKSSIALFSLLISVTAWANQGTTTQAPPAATETTQEASTAGVAVEAPEETQVIVERENTTVHETEHARSFERPIASSRDRSQRGKR
jgi:hypothetical protein